MIGLRPATRTDAALLMEWRNDPEVVEASITGRSVEPGEHGAWLDRVLADPAQRLFIVETGGEPVGQVRLEDHGEETEVHIGLAAEARGRGLGAEVLDRAAAEAGDRVLMARVLAANERSLRAFASAGFRERERSGEVVTLERRPGAG